jgi:MFS transporter, ACS family, tartrate transporter
MAAWSRRCDRAGNPARHLAVPALIGSAAQATVLITSSPTAILLGIGIGLACALAAIPVFWSLAATLLTGGSGLHDAAGIAAINTVASLASFTGPYLTGRLKDATGGYTAGLGLVAASLAVTGLSASAMHLSARTRIAR